MLWRSRYNLITYRTWSGIQVEFKNTKISIWTGNCLSIKKEKRKSVWTLNWIANSGIPTYRMQNRMQRFHVNVLDSFKFKIKFCNTFKGYRFLLTIASMFLSLHFIKVPQQLTYLLILPLNYERRFYLLHGTIRCSIT